MSARTYLPSVESARNALAEWVILWVALKLPGTAQTINELRLLSVAVVRHAEAQGTLGILTPREHWSEYCRQFPLGIFEELTTHMRGLALADAAAPKRDLGRTDIGTTTTPGA